MWGLFLLLNGAIDGLMALAAFWALRRFGKQPSFAAVFIWCAIALVVLSAFVATLIQVHYRANR